MGTKISSYTVVTNPDPNSKLVAAIGGIGGADYSQLLSDLPTKTFLNRFTGGAYRDDFWNTNRNRYPWIAQAVGAGTIAMQASIASHPGIVRVSPNGANTGYTFYNPNENTILLAGNEFSELIFQVVTSTNFVLMFGFGDNFATGATPTDGVYINIAATTLDGRTRNNGVGNTTATNIVISTSTWYRARIVLRDNALGVDFYLFNAAGTQLWTDSLITNIPTTRVTGHGVTVQKTTAGAVAAADLDYMSLLFKKLLVR